MWATSLAGKRASCCCRRRRRRRHAWRLQNFGRVACRPGWWCDKQAYSITVLRMPEAPPDQHPSSLLYSLL